MNGDGGQAKWLATPVTLPVCLVCKIGSHTFFPGLKCFFLVVFQKCVLWKSPNLVFPHFFQYAQEA